MRVAREDFEGLALVALLLVRCDTAAAPQAGAADTNVARTAGANSAADASAAAAAVAAPAQTLLPTTGTTAGATGAASSLESLRQAAARDPGAFEGKAVSLDGFYVKLTQRTFGTGEHPRHYFAVVHLALDRGAEDLLECESPDNTWTPTGLEPGAPIRVSGKWSFDRMLAGGIAPGGGPLHIAGCRVSKQP